VLTALAVLWPQPFLAPARPLPPPGPFSAPSGLGGWLPWYLWAPALLTSWLPSGWGLALLLLLLLAPGLLPFWGQGAGRPPEQTPGRRPLLARLLPLLLALWVLASLWGVWKW
jgi:hypothetical protein